MERPLSRLLYWIALNILAFWLVVKLVPGVSAETLWDLVGIGVLLALVNGWIGPILRFVTCPLRLLTFGLFSLIVNWLLFLFALWLGRKFGAGVTVSGMLPAFVGAIVVAIVTTIGDKINPFR